MEGAPGVAAVKLLRRLLAAWRSWRRRRRCARAEHGRDDWELVVFEYPEATHYGLIPPHIKMRIDLSTSRVRIEKRRCRFCGVREWVGSGFCDRCRIVPGLPTPRGFRRCDVCSAAERK